MLNITHKLTLSRIFLGILVSFLIGIFIGGFFDSKLVDYQTLVIATILLTFVGCIFYREKLIKILILWSITIIVSCGYYCWYLNKIIPENLPYDQNIEFIGIIIDEPDVREIETKLTVKVEEVIQLGDYLVNQNNRLIDQSTNKRVNELTNQRIDELTSQRILITTSRYPEYQYGDKLKITGKLEKPGKFLTEDSDKAFDYGKYLLKDKIFSIITHPTNVECIDEGHGNKFFQILYKVKNHFELTINNILPEPMAALLDGLLLGVKKNIPDDLMSAFNATGTTHIIAVSGFNVTIIVRAFERLSQHWSKNLSFGLGTLGLLTFVILTGAQASVVRAAIMAFMFLLARQLGRKSDITIAVTFVACIMVILNPFILRTDVGFQLSFLAVLGLIYISPIFDSLLTRWPRLIREPLSATLGAQIPVMPLVLANFGRLSIVSPLANVLILEIIPWTMLAGFIAAIAGMVFLPLGQILGWGAWVMLEYIILAAEYCSKLPFASIQVTFSQWYFIILYFILLITMRIKISKLLKVSKDNIY